ncbi:hypothetical protein ACHAXN_002732 [Cyclotella atomus]
MTSSGSDQISKTDAVTLALNATRSSIDLTTNRREFTRLLNQLKTLLRPLSNQDCLAVLSNSIDGSGLIDNSTVATLFAIVNNEDDFSTDGHRETSLELLRGLVGGLFRKDDSVSKVPEDECITANSECRNDQLHRDHVKILTVLFDQSAATFETRMMRNIADPLESCEHIRLLLVELMAEVTSLLNQAMVEATTNKTALQAASVVCQTLAKSVFSDPHPEVQRASCSLVEKLSQLCPLAVRMNASALLFPLAGNPESYSTLKSSLFRHRHTKTRCKAVDAAAAVLLCCPSEHDSCAVDTTNNDSTYDEGKQSTPESTEAIDTSKWGSKSTSVEQLLQDYVLSGWEELLKLDASVSVRQATLEALGNSVKALKWGDSQSISSSTADLASVVETKVLYLFVLGISDGNAQVRALAVQQLRNFQHGKVSAPLDILTRYHQAMLDLVLDQCCIQGVLSGQSKVRSIEALQVLLALVIPMPTVDEQATIDKLAAVLSDSILADEKDVLDASLKACRIIGGSELALDILTSISEMNQRISNEDNESSDDIETIITPRRLASTLLLLDGIVKGCGSNQEKSSILHEVDPSIAVHLPIWFESASTRIANELASDSVFNCITSNSSLAWALSDAVSSFIGCVETSQEGSKTAESSAVEIMTCITYLLGCPHEFGLFARTKSLLHKLSSASRFTSSADTSEASSPLLDRYFRDVAFGISSSAPFPWKRNDPAFQAIDALMRNTKGSTVRDNFDMVAPLFLYHLPERKENVDREDPNEEYSLRISLMSLLQAVLSDNSFSGSSSLQCESSTLTSLPSQFSTQFTFDILLSLVLPNLVWRSGGLAAALRKLSMAALFTLLSHKSNRLGTIEHETYSYLIPILHSNLEDTESTTRELSCMCLSLTLSQMSQETFQQLWSNDSRVIDTLHPRLLALMDDSHHPVRLAALTTIEKFLAIASASNGSSDSNYLDFSALESITECLVLTLDDTESDIQKRSFQVLSFLVGLVSKKHNDNVIDMIERHATNGQKDHRDVAYCTLLLELCSEAK